MFVIQNIVKASVKPSGGRAGDPDSLVRQLFGA
jgi:hypothetical protein